MHRCPGILFQSVKRHCSVRYQLVQSSTVGRPSAIPKMNVHGGAYQIYIHVAVGFILPFVVSFAFADTRPCVGHDSGYGEVLFSMASSFVVYCDGGWLACYTLFQSVQPTMTLSSLRAAKLSCGLSEGEEGASPPLSADSPPVFRAMTLPFSPSVVPTPESHRDVAPRWRARSCEVLAHFSRRAVSRWDGHSVFYVR